MSALFVTASISIPNDELRVSFSRSGGPGGQNVNKVETQVELRWNLPQSRALCDSDRSWLQKRLANQLTADGDLIITSSLTRSQLRNREDASTKLAAVLREALHRPKRRRATRPGRGAIERRLSEKKQHSERKRSRQTFD